MTSDSRESRGIAINATGGVVIGLLLACFVIIGGLPLVMGAAASADDTNFPTRVDQRIAGTDASEGLGLADRSLELIRPIVVADAR